MANIIDDDKSGEYSIMPIVKNNMEIYPNEDNDGQNNDLIKSEREIEFTYRLSQQDMIVLNNIVKLSLVIIFISVIIIIMGILMQLTPILKYSIV